jgi:hypothetical protein
MIKTHPIDTERRTVRIKATSRELAQARAESAYGNLGTVVSVEQTMDREYAVTFERQLS